MAGTLEALRGMGYRAPRTGNLRAAHVHVGRKGMGKDACTSKEETIAKLLQIFERFWQEILRFPANKARSTAGLRGTAARSRRDFKGGKARANGRYAINLTNTDTIDPCVPRNSEILI